MMHKTCSINYGHLADLQKTLPTTDLNKKIFMDLSVKEFLDKKSYFIIGILVDKANSLY